LRSLREKINDNLLRRGQGGEGLGGRVQAGASKGGQAARKTGGVRKCRPSSPGVGRTGRRALKKSLGKKEGAVRKTP